MASVDWKKLGSSSIYANVAHMNRHDGKDVTYSNLDIDPNKTQNNYTIGGWGNGSHNTNFFLKNRIKELDKIHPPQRIRKDRVTAIGFVVHPPKWMTPKQEREFYKFAHGCITTMCGGSQNVTHGKVHMDEIHKYYDKIKGEFVMSRSHMHMIGLPWTNKFGINAKNFCTRWRMIDLNKQLDAFCVEKWNQHYLDGHCDAPSRNMAQLKAESRALELELHNEEVFELDVRQAQLTQSIQEDKDYKCQLEAQISGLEARRDDLQTEVDKLAQSVSKRAETRLKRALEFMDGYMFDDRYSFKDKFLEFEKRLLDRDGLEK